MAPDTLTIRKDNDYFSLKYSIQLLNSSGQIEQQCIIADKAFVVRLQQRIYISEVLTLQLNVHLYINGNKLNAANYGGLVEGVGHSFASCRYWKQIDMDPSLFISNNNPVLEGTASFLLGLDCNVTRPVFNQLLDVKTAVPTAINFLRLLDIDIYYNSLLSILKLADYVDALNYLFGSLFINLEFKLPFVFSFYGRKLFKTNYNWIVRNLGELSKTFPSYPSPTKDTNVMFAQSLQTLQLKIRAEYNTLSVMKDCDASSSKLEAHRRYKARQFDVEIPLPATFPIKSMVYDLHVLDLLFIESHLDI